MCKFKVGDNIIANTGPDTYVGCITQIWDNAYRILWTSNGWPKEDNWHKMEHIDHHYSLAVVVRTTAPNDVQQVDCQNISAYIDCSDNLD